MDDQVKYLDLFQRAELIAEYSRVKSELNQLKIKTEDVSTKQKTDNLKKELEAVITACENRLTAQKEDLKIQSNQSAEVSINGESWAQTMKEHSVKQNILDIVRSTSSLKTGESIENFLGALQQIYTIEVKPLLTSMVSLEAEFVNAVKRKLTFPMFTQLEKSGNADIKEWEKLRKYLLTTHGSRISNFQHLNKLWTCEIQDGEKLSVFAARLEDKIHAAASTIKASYKKEHNNQEMTADDVFAIIGAMLASLQVRNSYEDAYKSLIKTCDKHWNASSLLADAADYADKMPRDDKNVSSIFHAKAVKPKQNSSGKRVSEKPTKAKKRPSLEEYKMKCSKQICEAYLQNRCKYGEKCFRIHPVKSHFTEVAEAEDNLATLFHQGSEQK